MAKRIKTRKRISSGDRQRVMKRDHYVCGYCGKRKEPNLIQIDHIIPVKKGGYHGIENFVTACKNCNGNSGKWYFAPRENGAPALIMHSGRKVAKLTWLAKGKRFPARIPKISYIRHEAH